VKSKTKRRKNFRGEVPTKKRKPWGEARKVTGPGVGRGKNITVWCLGEGGGELRKGKNAQRELGGKGDKGEDGGPGKKKTETVFC